MVSIQISEPADLLITHGVLITMDAERRIDRAARALYARMGYAIPHRWPVIE